MTLCVCLCVCVCVCVSHCNDLSIDDIMHVLPRLWTAELVVGHSLLEVSTSHLQRDKIPSSRTLKLAWWHSKLRWQQRWWLVAPLQWRYILLDREVLPLATEADLAPPLATSSSISVDVAPPSRLSWLEARHISRAKGIPLNLVLFWHLFNNQCTYHHIYF